MQRVNRCCFFVGEKKPIPKLRSNTARHAVSEMKCCARSFFCPDRVSVCPAPEATNPFTPPEQYIGSPSVRSFFLEKGWSFNGPSAPCLPVIGPNQTHVRSLFINVGCVFVRVWCYQAATTKRGGTKSKKFELTEEQKQEIREAFDLFDTDGSGEWIKPPFPVSATRGRRRLLTLELVRVQSV